MTPSRRVPAGLALLVVAVFPACARPGQPRGGPVDQRAPAVIETDPLPLAVVEPGGGVIRFRFDERVSERPSRGTLDEAVTVSPATGPVRVEHDGDALEVRIGGGLRPGVVYRITLRPVIADLFGNAMPEPFELVFSTGASFTEDALAGEVLDRLTGETVAGASVLLLPMAATPDTLLHRALSDEDGLFYFRYLPPGSYRLLAFEDRNRSGGPDLREPVGERSVLVGEGDTLIVQVPILQPDSTPAELVRVEVVDSTTLRMLFTDYLDPGAAAAAAVRLEDDRGEAPGVVRVLAPQAWEDLRDSLAAVGDTAPADAAASAGRLPRPGQTMAVPGQERGGLPVGIPLPSQELVVMLDAPLVPNRPYRLTTTSVLNLNRVPLGGGQASVVREPPPPADSAAVAPVGGFPDSAAAGPVEARPDAGLGLPPVADSVGDRPPGGPR